MSSTQSTNSLNLKLVIPLSLMVLSSIFLIYLAVSFNSSVDFLDALMIGLAESSQGVLGLILAILIGIMYIASKVNTTTVWGKILNFTTGKIFGFITFFVTFITVLLNVATAYLKIIEENPLHIMVGGNGYADVIIILCAIYLLFVKKQA